MLTIRRVVLSAALLFFSSTVFSLPDAVCGNGEHVGNPHCASSSSAPIKNIGSEIIGAGILFAAGTIGLWLQRRDKRQHAHKTPEMSLSNDTADE